MARSISSFLLLTLLQGGTEKPARLWRILLFLLIQNNLN